MTDIRLIAFDLDDTLLNSQKELSPVNAAALARAAAFGVELVPATGRFFRSMPEAVRGLPFLRYVIAVNGAQVYDVREGAAIARAEMPLALALEIMTYLDDLPVIYDCFADGWGWMSRAHQDRAEEFSSNEHYARMLRDFRTPVDDLKAFLRAKGGGVQKVQLFTRNMDLHGELLRGLEGRFPRTAVSSSIVNNVEINDARATKGTALRSLAAHLGVPLSRTLAFGDGLNDLSMIRAAGVGVAMGNARPEVRDAADFVTLTCDEDGVAAGIERFCPAQGA